MIFNVYFSEFFGFCRGHMFDTPPYPPPPTHFELSRTKNGRTRANHRLWSRLYESQTLVTALRITDPGHGFANHRLWSRLYESQTLVTAFVVYHEGRLPSIIDFFWLWHYSSILSRSMLDFTLFEILHNCLVKIPKWYDIRILITQRCNHSSVAF